ncbi:hypothetical protein AAVH_09673, partial [Aphelenchoides avenae]
VTSVHPSIESDEVLPTTVASPPVKKSVTFKDIQGSLSISGAVSTFIVAILVVKRFIALEDCYSYAGLVGPWRTCSAETHESLEMLSAGVTHATSRRQSKRLSLK